uniref:hydroxymethylglutaryl-CoA lyase n=1 Tax=Solanum tuberosum TaxID=4113 RepID=M1CJB8_SOLTU
MDVIKSQQISSRPIEKVIVHPLVLLSIVDHYNRVARDTRKCVVGVLLGTSFKGTVDVTNSYAAFLWRCIAISIRLSSYLVGGVGESMKTDMSCGDGDSSVTRLIYASLLLVQLSFSIADRQPKSYSNHRSTVRKTFKLFNGMPNHVKIVEVGARDGLQNKKKIVPTSVKVELIQKLVSCGLPVVEVTGFVSPKWVPQLSDAKDVMEAVKDLEDVSGDKAELATHSKKKNKCPCLLGANT